MCLKVFQENCIEVLWNLLTTAEFLILMFRRSIILWFDLSWGLCKIQCTTSRVYLLSTIFFLLSMFVLVQLNEFSVKKRMAAAALFLWVKSFSPLWETFRPKIIRPFRQRSPKDKYFREAKFWNAFDRPSGFFLVFLIPFYPNRAKSNW